MKKTLDRKIKEFKTIAYKGDSDRQLHLLGEIYSLAEVLNCKLEVAKDLAEFLEAKEKEIKANKKDNKMSDLMKLADLKEMYLRVNTTM